MNQIRARRTASSTVLFLIAGLVTVAAMTSTAGPAAAAAPDPGTYQALTPARILDTRTGNGAPTAPVAAAATLNVTVLGQGGIPASGVSAVVFNLTDAGPTTYGFITAYPAGQPLPLASSINFSAGETRAHLVVVAPGTSGRVALYNGSAAPVDMVADVAGYYTAGTPTAGGEFAPLTPARILDTRTGNGAPKKPLGGRDWAVVRVAGRGGVPQTGVSAAVINLTATRPSTFGLLQATSSQYNSQLPRSSSVNFHGGNSVSNLIVVPLRSDGSIDVIPRLDGHVDIVADVVGYFVDGAPSAPGRLGGVTPTRLLDTRDNQSPIPPQSSIDLVVAGDGNVPVGSTAAALNVTVASAAGSGYLTVYPPSGPRPTASTVNFDNNTVANLTVSALDADGKVRIYNGSSVSVNVVVDVTAFVGAIPGGLTWSGRSAVPGADAFIGDVSCATTSFCVAIDDIAVHRWDGQSWSAPTKLARELAQYLTCPVVGFCAADVDNTVEVSDGTTWKSTGWPAAGQEIVALSCTSATFCVGFSRDSSTYKVATASYDGHVWTSHQIGTGNAFQVQDPALSCTSATFCLASGYNEAFRFDGTAWASIAVLPDFQPSSLSCVSSTFCMALDLRETMIYNGSVWTKPVPLGTAETSADEVSCASTTLCIAITQDQTQFVYDGTTWSNSLQIVLDTNAVDCFAPRDCMVITGPASSLGT